MHGRKWVSLWTGSIFFWPIYISTYLGKLGSLSETKDEKKLYMFLVKNNGEVLIFYMQLATLVLHPCLCLSSGKQNKTNGESNTIMMYRGYSAISGNKNRALNTFCSLPKLNHLDMAGIFVWFLPCLVAERNILPWIRQSHSNQRCLDAAWNVIIFPLTSVYCCLASFA